MPITLIARESGRQGADMSKTDDDLPVDSANRTGAMSETMQGMRPPLEMVSFLQNKGQLIA